MHSTSLPAVGRAATLATRPGVAGVQRCAAAPPQRAPPIALPHPLHAARLAAPGAAPGGADAGPTDDQPEPSLPSSTFNADDPAAWAARRAAELAVERFVEGAGAVKSVGVGAGELAHHLIAALAAATAAGRLPPSMTVACAGAPAAAEAALAGLNPAPPATGATAFPATDVFFVTAAGLDPTTRPGLAYLTGAGPPPHANPGAPQPALAETLAGARAAKAVVALVPPDAAASGGADGRLGPAALPVLVEATDDWETSAEELDDAFLGDAEVWRRPTTGPSGPAGGVNPRGGPDPYLTPDGSATLLDVVFETPFRLVDDEGVSYEEVLSAAASCQGFLDAGLVPPSAPGAARAAVVAGAGPGGAPVVVEV